MLQQAIASLNVGHFPRQLGTALLMRAVFQASRRNDIAARGGGFLELCCFWEFRGTWDSKRDVGFQTGYTGSLLDIHIPYITPTNSSFHFPLSLDIIDSQ